MLDYYVLVAFSCSIAIAAIIGMIRYKRIAAVYRPFIYLCIFALVNELVSIASIERYRTNVYNANIYILLELYLLLWLFYQLGKLKRTRQFYFFVALILTLIWIADNFIIHPFAQFNSLYRVSYATTLVFLAIDHINYVIVTERKKILRNPGFLIAVAVLLFYAVKGVVEVFYLFQINLSHAFYNALIVILAISNLITNLIYAIAMLWMPRKQKFSILY